MTSILLVILRKNKTLWTVLFKKRALPTAANLFELIAQLLSEKVFQIMMTSSLTHH